MKKEGGFYYARPDPLLNQTFPRTPRRGMTITSEFDADLIGSEVKLSDLSSKKIRIR